MSLIAKGGGDYEKAPAGNHPAVLVAVIDMGTQWQGGYQGQPGRFAHRAYFVYELVTKKDSKDRRFLIAIDLGLSTHEKSKLAKFVLGRTGKKPPPSGYDVSEELGKPVLLNVILSESGYPKVDGVSAVPDGLTFPPSENPPTVWSITGPQCSFDGIPEWVPYHFGRPITEAIKLSKEWAGTGESAKPARSSGQGGGDPFTPPARPGKPGSAMPPSRGPSAPQKRKWWADDPAGQPVLLLESALKVWATGKGLDLDAVYVMPEDKSSDWVTAKDAGIGASIPF